MSRGLLWIDAAVNLGLGALLLVFPKPAMVFLGVPIPESAFYASILGAVIFGIGMALVIQVGRAPERTGLGLHGAIAINFCGAACLVVWLVFGELGVPTRGLIVLWAIAVVVLAIGAVELVTTMRRGGD